MTSQQYRKRGPSSSHRKSPRGRLAGIGQMGRGLRRLDETDRHVWLGSCYHSSRKRVSGSIPSRSQQCCVLFVPRATVGAERTKNETRRAQKQSDRVHTGLLAFSLSFAIIVLLGKLSTSVAVSWVLPPTRTMTLPALSAIVARRLRKGTWMKDL